MFNHVMVGSNDIERSKRFYDAVLGVLGVGEPVRNTANSGHVRLFYRHESDVLGISQPINDEPATAGNGSTFGFKCASPDQVREFHDVAVTNGGTSIEDAPGPRDTSMGTVHLSYVRDPDGNKLCALYRGEERRRRAACRLNLSRRTTPLPARGRTRAAGYPAAHVSSSVRAIA